MAPPVGVTAAETEEVPVPAENDGALCDPEAQTASLETTLFEPEPMRMTGCAGTGGCNTAMDCRQQGYYCPTGTWYTCFDSTGNCDGWCGCS